jgi:enoyl-CoA hydratase/carnithine racemase
MPAAYVEIIKYALGAQIGALATLRGKLYELDEAARLGFFHEVVEPDKLLATAISYARCITPDCNTAYAMSKKALTRARQGARHPCRGAGDRGRRGDGAAGARRTGQDGVVPPHAHGGCFPRAIGSSWLRTHCEPR